MTDPSNNSSFTILFRIPGATDPDEYAGRVYESRLLGDALLGGPDATEVFDLEVECNANSFSRASLAAIGAVQEALPEAEILRVEPDDLVTIAAIAHRLGRSHESVRLLTQGRRGPGGFPPPAGRIDSKTQVWRWSEVAPWLRTRMGIEVPDPLDTAFLAALNDVLELRRLADEAITEPEVASELAALLPKRLSDAAA